MLQQLLEVEGVGGDAVVNGCRCQLQGVCLPGRASEGDAGEDEGAEGRSEGGSALEDWRILGFGWVRFVVLVDADDESITSGGSDDGVVHVSQGEVRSGYVCSTSEIRVVILQRITDLTRLLQQPPIGRPEILDCCIYLLCHLIILVKGQVHYLLGHSADIVPIQKCCVVAECGIACVKLYL